MAEIPSAAEISEKLRYSPSVCVLHFYHDGAVLLKAVVVTDDVGMVQHGQHLHLKQDNARKISAKNFLQSSVQGANTFTWRKQNKQNISQNNLQ